MSVRTSLGPCVALAATAAVTASLALTTVLTPAALAGEGPGRWSCLAHYESTHRWHVNTGNGHYGGLQFSRSTWNYYGGPQWSGNHWPHRATKREQKHVAKRVAHRGWRDRAPQGGASAWPNTWSTCG